MPRLSALLSAVLALLLAAPAAAQAPAASPALVLAPQEGDVVLRDFRFRSGERLPELRLHYATLGRPQRDRAGRVTNAVMLLHGTGGSGRQFLRPQFADVLFKPGGLLDPARYYVILPDGIGHGRSSKPSDGLRARFPQYDYDDMVAAHQALARHLAAPRLRLVLGTSMGCMHIFAWAETDPDFAEAAMPLACLPTEIAGRNRLWRRMAMEAIRADPAWNGGDYAQQPLAGLRTAEDLLILAGTTPLVAQQAGATRDAADRWLEQRFAGDIGNLDANDLWFQLNASRNYDPSPGLERIVTPMTWVNSADDFINPPELGLAERLAPRLKTTRYVLLPTGPETRGHGTHTWAAVWEDHLAGLLHRTERR
jgi:homoserine O-acetyltransferase